MAVIIAFGLPCLVCGGLVAFFYQKQAHKRRFGCKLLGSLLFCAAAFAALAQRGAASTGVALMLAAFVLGLVGDVLLALPPFVHERYNRYFYLLGGGAFWAGHVLYAAAFLWAGGFSFATLPLILSMPLIFLLLVALKWMTPGGMLPPVLLYGPALGAVLAGAAGLAAAGLPAGGPALAGAVLFCCSDAALFLFDYGTEKLRRLKPALNYGLMLSYYGAQLLFCVALLYL